MDTTDPSTRALTMARRALAILEAQAAGHTALSMPVHLQIELEEKRREVAELETRLSQAMSNHTAPPANTIFDQREQQVTTQINVAGNYYAVAPPVSGSTGNDGNAGDIRAPQMTTDLPALRARLQRLDAVSIESLCLDYFPAVYDTFSRGLRRDEMTNLLLDHCRRNPEAAAQLAVLLK